MLKISKFLLLVLALLTVSCNGKDEFEERWDKMEWQKVTYGSISKKGRKYVQIPKEGGTCTFKCKNYKKFWLSHVAITKDGSSIVHHDISDDRFSFTDKTIQVYINGDVMTVHFPPSDGNEREFEILVTAGNIFYYFYLIQ